MQLIFMRRMMETLLQKIINIFLWDAWRRLIMNICLYDDYNYYQYLSIIKALHHKC